MSFSRMFVLSLVTTTLATFPLSAVDAKTAKEADPCDGKVFSENNRLCTVITAHRLKQPLSAVGSSITVITHNEMERRGVRNIADALKRVPGLAMARTGGFGSTTTMRIRGSNPGQVRVMIDGVTVNDPTNTETFYDFGQLLTNNVERIEVIRGPQSSLYGADTTGGVVNIITRRDKSMHTAGFGGVGSHGTYHAGLSHQNTLGKFYYGVSGEHFMNKGFSRNSATPTEEDHTRVDDFKANIGADLTEQVSFNVSGGAARDISDFDPSATVDGPAVSKRTTYLGNAEGKMKLFDGQLQNTVKLGLHDSRRLSDEPLGFFRYSTFDGKRYQASYQADLALRKRDVATLGTDWQRDESFTSTISGGVSSVGIDEQVTNRAAFGQYVFGITDDWTLTVGGRHDDHSSFNTANTYRATTAYDLQKTNTVFRASYGTGFKAPSLFQLFAASFGTPTLRPEESKGMDIGIEQRLIDGRLTLGITGFRNDYSNLIVFDLNSFTYQNINRSNTRGIESTAAFAVTPEVLVSANHTYLQSEDESTKRSLARRPNHTAGLAVDVDVSDRARVGAEALFVSDQWDRDSGILRVRPHTTFNLSGSFDINDHYQLYTSLENITDKDYEEIVGFRAPGFTAFAGIRAEY